MYLLVDEDSDECDNDLYFPNQFCFLSGAKALVEEGNMIKNSTNINGDNYFHQAHLCNLHASVVLEKCNAKAYN